MSHNIDQQRKDLDAKLAEIGYQHPEQNSQGASLYKIYAEDGTDTYVSQHQDPYATFNTDQPELKQNQVHKTDICPTCEEKASYSCPCPVGEMMCKKGHMWYVQKNGTVVLGDPHEGDD